MVCWMIYKPYFSFVNNQFSCHFWALERLACSCTWFIYLCLEGFACKLNYFKLDNLLACKLIQSGSIFGLDLSRLHNLRTGKVTVKVSISKSFGFIAVFSRILGSKYMVKNCSHYAGSWHATMVCVLHCHIGNCSIIKTIRKILRINYSKKVYSIYIHKLNQSLFWHYNK